MGAKQLSRLDAESSEPSLDDLVGRVCDGDASAWERLATELAPLVAAIATRRSRKLLPDDHSSIYIAVLERLSKNNHAALRRYLRRRLDYSHLRFNAYLAAVVASALIDHLRAQPDSLRRREHQARRLIAIQVTTLEDAPEPSDAGAEAKSMAQRLDAKRLMTQLLDVRFPAQQRRALLLWLHGSSGTDIANELELRDAKEANRLVRAARARLRRAEGKDQ